MAPHFDIITIFPGTFAGVIGESILGRAIASGLLEVELTDLRDFTTDKHRSVDDRPYGGGPGMVFKPEPVFDAVEHVLARRPVREGDGRQRRILLTPQGRRLDQSLLRELAQAEHIVLVCGHYEGFDERIVQGLGCEQVSIGDFVLSGGELPAMVILDGVARLLPGALGHPESSDQESFEHGLSDHPPYTRPAEFRGMRVAEVLLSGTHAEIERWRRSEARSRTRALRGDLLAADRDASSMLGSAGTVRARPRTRAGSDVEDVGGEYEGPAGAGRSTRARTLEATRHCPARRTRDSADAADERAPEQRSGDFTVPEGRDPAADPQPAHAPVSARLAADRHRTGGTHPGTSGRRE